MKRSTQAIKDQLDRIAHGYRYTFTCDPLEELTEHRAPGLRRSGLTQMIFVSGGSEAVESCLKIALQYHAPAASRPAAASSPASAPGTATRWARSPSPAFANGALPFEGALVEASLLSPGQCLSPAGRRDARNAWPSICADELEHEILRLGADDVAAFIFEPVVGRGRRRRCLRRRAMPSACARSATGHGVLMIADEVMCGAGRCGTWRALEHDGVVPDIMAVAKGLAGGYLPLGAAVYSQERLAEPIAQRHGGPLTGHTFTGHTAGLRRRRRGADASSSATGCSTRCARTGC